MKKNILFLTILLVTPIFAFAGYNDVTLTTNSIVSVGGYTLNITGSSAVVQSIVVNSTNFTITLSSGSHIQISSPTYNQLTTDINTFTTSNNCANSTSILTLSSSGPSGTVTVTPGATICSTASNPAPTPPASTGGGNGPIVGSFGQQIQQDGSTVLSTTSPAFMSTPILVPSVPPAIVLFTKDLRLNQVSTDVKRLQQYLNTHNFIIAKTGAGSPNHETTTFGALTYKTLKAFQKSVGLPSTGFFGPMTREYINKR